MCERVSIRVTSIRVSKRVNEHTCERATATVLLSAVWMSEVAEEEYSMRASVQSLFVVF